MGRRRDLLDLILLRFGAPASVYRHIEQQLATITAEDQFRLLLAAIVRTDSVAAFQTVLQEVTSAQNQA
jgi:hypothetical protein